MYLEICYPGGLAQKRHGAPISRDNDNHVGCTECLSTALAWRVEAGVGATFVPLMTV